MSLEARTSFQDRMTNIKIQMLLDHIEIQPVSLIFFNYWSICLYPFQNMTLYEVILSKLPHLRSSNADTSTIWNIAALLCRFEELWKLVCETDIRTSKWHS